jgi:hypothetical protein
MPKDLVEVRCGAPRAMKKQIGASVVLSHLNDLRFTAEAEFSGMPSVLRYRAKSPRAEDVARAKATMLAEQVALETLRSWAKNLGLASYDKVVIRGANPRPEFANFHFDLVGPSYVRPLATMGAGQLTPGFLVADMWLDKELTDECVEGFLRKTRIVRSVRNARPFLAVLMADRFSRDAFLLGRKNGAIFTTPEYMFGTHVAHALVQLVQTLSDAATRGHADPDAVTDLFDNLGKIEGAASNLRGPLFELITAYVLTTLHGGKTSLSRIVSGVNGQRKEIDVLAEHPDRVRACECKGHGPGTEVSLDEVKKWVEEALPIWREGIRGLDTSEKKISFAFWTTGVFSPDAKAFLEARAQSTKKYQIEWLDGQGVLEEVRRTKAPRLVDTLNEHYIRHPLYHDGATP